MSTLNFNNDRKKEMEADIIIDYFKLLKLVEIADSYEVFKNVVGGEEMLDRIIERSNNLKEPYLSVSVLTLLSQLKDDLLEISKSSYSLSYVKQFGDLGWLEDVVVGLNPCDPATNALLLRTTYEVREKCLDKKLDTSSIINNNQSTKYSLIPQMLQDLNDIVVLSKRFKMPGSVN